MSYSKNNLSTPLRSDKCLQHGQSLTHYNVETRNLLCDYCLHSYEGDQIFDLVGCTKNMEHEIPKLKDEVEHLKKTLKDMKLPAGSGRFEKEIDNLANAKKNAMIIIEEYFDSLFEAFAAIYSSCPSSDSQTLLDDEMTQYLQSLKTFSQKLEEKSIDMMDVKHYYDDQLETKTKGIKEKINFFEKTTKSHDVHKDVLLLESKIPCISVNKNILDDLNQKLVEYTHILFPLEPSDLEIYNNNYFSQHQEKVLSHINDHHKTITIYNLNMKKAVVLPLKNQESPIPYSHSSIVTPDSQIFINGGIYLSNGHITNENFEFNSKNLELDVKRPMNVKRVGHSLVYNGEHGQYIYAIGGITNNNVRTKLCEKYNIETGKWTNIASMNHGRARAATTTFNENYIYAFFGTSSRGNTLDSVERYDIRLNKWTELSPLNILPNVGVTCASCCQINESKIVIFGGLNDSSLNQDHFTLSRRIIIYDVNKDSVNLAEYGLPIDYISSSFSQPIVNDGSIYCLGNFLQSIKPQTKRCLDSEYVLKIDHTNIELSEIVKTSMPGKIKSVNTSNNF